MKKPNILYLHSHDTGRYIQPYGFNIPTPNIQKLAEQGILFRQCFSAGPTCSPSRAALLTGEYPHCCGMLGLAHTGWQLKDSKHHIVHTLRKEGYYSALIGFQHVTGWEHADCIGYDYVEDIRANDSYVDDIVPRVLKFLKNKFKQPFFLSAGVIETHRFHNKQYFSKPPETGPHIQEGDPRYCRAPAPIPDTPETRKDMADFIEAARRMDSGYGKILDELKKQGLDDNTLIINTTDHGISFPSMKCNLTDHGTGVFLIIKGPEGFEGGKVIDAMVTHMDIYPTLCDLLKIKKPSWLQGESMIPLIHGKKEEIHDTIFSELNYHCSYEPRRAVRTKRRKYIRYFGGKATPAMENCDKAMSGQVWLKHGWDKRKVEKEELYDLIFDPNEACNLAGKQEHSSVLDEMRGRLMKWMMETNDPILKGPIPPPGK